jgi:hypothetical protein
MIENLEEIQYMLLNSHIQFSEFMFNVIEGGYNPTPFDNIFGQTIDRVFSGEIKRLIINIPVGMGKTQRAVIAVIARGLALQPKSRFLHISYDITLVNNNSSIAKDFIESEDYQSIFPNIKLKKDTTAKGLWKTEQGGALRAVSSGSGITGFRAGNQVIKGFSGALIIDDPLKPDDMRSLTKLEWINNRFHYSERHQPWCLSGCPGFNSPQR